MRIGRVLSRPRRPTPKKLTPTNPVSGSSTGLATCSRLRTCPAGLLLMLGPHRWLARAVFTWLPGYLEFSRARSRRDRERQGRSSADKYRCAAFGSRPDADSGFANSRYETTACRFAWSAGRCEADAFRRKRAPTAVSVASALAQTGRATLLGLWRSSAEGLTARALPIVRGFRR